MSNHGDENMMMKRIGSFRGPRINTSIPTRWGYMMELATNLCKGLLVVGSITGLATYLIQNSDSLDDQFDAFLEATRPDSVVKKEEDELLAAAYEEALRRKKNIMSSPTSAIAYYTRTKRVDYDPDTDPDRMLIENLQQREERNRLLISDDNSILSKGTTQGRFISPPSTKPDSNDVEETLL